MEGQLLIVALFWCMLHILDNDCVTCAGITTLTVHRLVVLRQSHRWTTTITCTAGVPWLTQLALIHVDLSQTGLNNKHAFNPSKSCTYCFATIKNQACWTFAWSFWNHKTVWKKTMINNWFKVLNQRCAKTSAMLTFLWAYFMRIFLLKLYYSPCNWPALCSLSPMPVSVVLSRRNIFWWGTTMFVMRRHLFICCPANYCSMHTFYLFISFVLN